ncbi:MAG: hypothetical protein LBR45_01905, partial [Bacteroidales bacterium]|nr:hypothetical protein [Bacteroidales bacterium]
QLQTSFGYTAGLSGKNTSNNFRLSTGYVLKKSHRFNLSMGYLARRLAETSAQPNGKRTGEFTATVSYSYNFNMDVVKKIKELKN